MWSSVSTEKLFHLFFCLQSPFLNVMTYLYVFVMERQNILWIKLQPNICAPRWLVCLFVLLWSLFSESFCWVTENKSKVLVKRKGRIRVSQWSIEPSVDSAVQHVSCWNEPLDNCWLTGTFYFHFKSQGILLYLEVNSKVSLHCKFISAEKFVTR